tara:strand:+ start:11476 stop:11700 length:225 start_codon:yes stop_codon:yes gene_type:complete
MKKKNTKDANLVSFKILLTKENEIVTELSSLPEKEVDNIFYESERDIVRFILRKGKEKLIGLHSLLQKDLNSRG